METIWPQLLSASCVGLGLAGLLSGRTRGDARLTKYSLTLLFSGVLLLLLPWLFDALGLQNLAAYRTLITFTLPALGAGINLLMVIILLQWPAEHTP